VCAEAHEVRAYLIGLDIQLASGSVGLVKLLLRNRLQGRLVLDGYLMPHWLRARDRTLGVAGSGQVRIGHRRDGRRAD
jgi:hypothetical protein